MYPRVVRLSVCLSGTLVPPSKGVGQNEMPVFVLQCQRACTMAGILCVGGVGLHVVRSGTFRPSLDAAFGAALGKGLSMFNFMFVFICLLFFLYN